MLTHLKRVDFRQQLKLAAVEEKKIEQADDIAQPKQEKIEDKKRLEFERGKIGANDCSQKGRAKM